MFWDGLGAAQSACARIDNGRFHRRSSFCASIGNFAEMRSYPLGLTRPSGRTLDVVERCQPEAMNMMEQIEGHVAVQRCDTFVGRTMNWLYDHLRYIPGFTPLVLADRLANRDEFPKLEAWQIPQDRLLWRAWRRVTGGKIYPPFRARLDRKHPCLLHSHFGYVAAGDQELRRALDVPWLVSFYGADVYLLGREAEWRQRYAGVFEEVTAVLALGPAMVDELVRLGCPREKLYVHPLGISTEEIPSQPRQLREGEPLRILFAGTFREKKGIQYLLHGVHLAIEAGVRLELTLVGDAAGRPGDQETKEEVFGLIQKLGLEGVTTHHSWLPFQELLSTALRSHIFAAPSIVAADGDAEGTPFVIQQMMATGMPVITTRHSDIPFVFGEYANILVPERDAPAIAGRICDYVRNPDRLLTDGRGLSSQIREHFNIRDRAADLAQMYARVR